MTDRGERPVVGQVGHFRGQPFGEEEIALGGRFPTVHQLPEQIGLPLHPFVKGQGDGGFHGLDDILRRPEPLEAAPMLLAKPVEQGGWRSNRAVADLDHRRVKPFAQIGDRAVDQSILRHDRVDQYHGLRVRCRHRLAENHHVERGLDPDQAGQALCPAGAGQQAKRHFGQAQPRRWRGDAIIADQCRLQPAAQRGAMDRGEDRLGRSFDAIEHIMQRYARQRLAEFTDVGPGDEGASGAGQQDAACHRVVQRAAYGLVQPITHGGGQGVHRWGIDRDDGDLVHDPDLNRGIYLHD